MLRARRDRGDGAGDGDFGAHDPQGDAGARRRRAARAGAGAPARAAGASRSRRLDPDAAGGSWSGWSRRTAAAIRSRCCCGRRRACGISPVGCASGATRSHFTTVAQLLRALGYSLQANVKTREGAQHPDRDAQFRHINARGRCGGRGGRAGDLDRYQEEGAGRRFQERGARVAARRRARARSASHDFKHKQLGKAIPYGVYDIAPTRGGSTSGSTTTPPSSRSTRSAAGGSTSASRATPTRTRCRSPPTAAAPTATAPASGRSSCKSSPTRPAWRSASATSRPAPQVEQNRAPPVLLHHQNWRGKPLVCYETIINLIAATTTSTGLEVYARLDQRDYPERSRSPTPRSKPSTSPRPVPPRVELHDRAIPRASRLIIYGSFGPPQLRLSPATVNRTGPTADDRPPPADTGYGFVAPTAASSPSATSRTSIPVHSTGWQLHETHVGIDRSPAPDGHGYWLVASDGGSSPRKPVPRIAPAPSTVTKRAIAGMTKDRLLSRRRWLSQSSPEGSGTVSWRHLL